MNKEEKKFINEPVINTLREILIEGFTPSFCSYCGASCVSLTVDIDRTSEEESTDRESKLVYTEYDVEYNVYCEKCGKCYYVHPFETRGLIKDIK